MAISPYKTFVAGEILTAADLNASFLQITNNGELVGFPATTSKDFDAQELILDSDGDTSITADTDDQIDFKVASADYFRMLLDSSIPDFRVLWNDAGATVGPYSSLLRQSATPVDGDVLGSRRWIGRDSGGADTVFAEIQGVAVDVTSPEEDGRLDFYTMVAGTSTKIAELGSGGFFGLTRGYFTHQTAPASAAPIEFTPFNSECRKFTVFFTGLTTDGSEEVIIQLSDAGGYHTTDYLCNTAKITGATASEIPFTTGFSVTDAGAAGDNYYGFVTFMRPRTDNHDWYASGVICIVNTDVSVATSYLAGRVSLDTALTAVRVTTTNTPDDWDGGGVGMHQE